MNINQKLINACIKQERKAQFDLYKQCFSVLMGVCLRYNKNKEDAEEILNQGFLKILQGLKKYPENAPFEAWIRRIMINTIIDEFRKNKKRLATFDYTDFQETNSPITTGKNIDFNNAEKQFDAEELEQMIQELPDMSQKVFNLFAIDGYSHKEIANMFAISTGTSKWHVSFARKELKEKINKRKANE